jgi:hypothetical protein
LFEELRPPTPPPRAIDLSKFISSKMKEKARSDALKQGQQTDHHIHVDETSAGFKDPRAEMGVFVHVDDHDAMSEPDVIAASQGENDLDSLKGDDEISQGSTGVVDKGDTGKEDMSLAASVEEPSESKPSLLGSVPESPIFEKETKNPFDSATATGFNLGRVSSAFSHLETPVDSSSLNRPNLTSASLAAARNQATSKAPAPLPMKILARPAPPPELSIPHVQHIVPSVAISKPNLGSLNGSGGGQSGFHSPRSSSPPRSSHGASSLVNSQHASNQPDGQNSLMSMPSHVSGESGSFTAQRSTQSGQPMIAYIPFQQQQQQGSSLNLTGNGHLYHTQMGPGDHVHPSAGPSSEPINAFRQPFFETLGTSSQSSHQQHSLYHPHTHGAIVPPGSHQQLSQQSLLHPHHPVGSGLPSAFQHLHGLGGMASAFHSNPQAQSGAMQQQQQQQHSQHSMMQQQAHNHQQSHHSHQQQGGHGFETGVAFSQPSSSPSFHLLGNSATGQSSYYFAPAPSSGMHALQVPIPLGIGVPAATILHPHISQQQQQQHVQHQQHQAHPSLHQPQQLSHQQTPQHQAQQHQNQLGFPQQKSQFPLPHVTSHNSSSPPPFNQSLPRHFEQMSQQPSNSHSANATEAGSDFNSSPQALQSNQPSAQVSRQTQPHHQHQGFRRRAEYHQMQEKSTEQRSQGNSQQEESNSQKHMFSQNNDEALRHHRKHHSTGTSINSFNTVLERIKSTLSSSPAALREDENLPNLQRKSTSPSGSARSSHPRDFPKEDIAQRAGYSNSGISFMVDDDASADKNGNVGHAAHHSGDGRTNSSSMRSPQGDVASSVHSFNKTDSNERKSLDPHGDHRGRVTVGNRSNKSAGKSHRSTDSNNVWGSPALNSLSPIPVTNSVKQVLGEEEEAVPGVDIVVAMADLADESQQQENVQTLSSAPRPISNRWGTQRRNEDQGDVLSSIQGDGTLSTDAPSTKSYPRGQDRNARRRNGRKDRDRQPRSPECNDGQSGFVKNDLGSPRTSTSSSKFVGHISDLKSDSLEGQGGLGARNRGEKGPYSLNRNTRGFREKKKSEKMDRPIATDKGPEKATPKDRPRPNRSNLPRTAEKNEGNREERSKRTSIGVNVPPSRRDKRQGNDRVNSADNTATSSS